MHEDKVVKKRKNGDDAEDGMGAVGNAISRSDMDNILAEFKVEFTATITRQVESVFSSSVSNVLGKYDKKIQGELEQAKERISTVEHKADKMEQDHAGAH